MCASKWLDSNFKAQVLLAYIYFVVDWVDNILSTILMLRNLGTYDLLSENFLIFDAFLLHTIIHISDAKEENYWKSLGAVYEYSKYDWPKK